MYVKHSTHNLIYKRTMVSVSTQASLDLMALSIYSSDTYPYGIIVCACVMVEGIVHITAFRVFCV